MKILANGELEFPSEGDFDRSAIELTIALASMPIAGTEQCTLNLNGNIKRGTGDEILVIEIAGKVVGWRVADTAYHQWRRHCHSAKERFERHFNVGCEYCYSACLINWNHLHARARKFITQGTVSLHKQVDRVIINWLKAQDFYFENISRLGAVHVNRSHQDVRSRPLVGSGNASFQCSHFRSNQLRRHAESLHLTRTSQGTLDLNDVARFHDSYRFFRGVIVSPFHRIRAGLHDVCFRLTDCRAKGQHEKHS